MPKKKAFTGAEVEAPAPRFDRENAEHVEAVETVLLQKAAEARESLPAFFEFVMKEELTGLPLNCAPHQRVGFDFILDHSRCVLIWPAGASKTICLVAMSLWLLGRDVTTRGVIISNTQKQAQKLLGMIQAYIDNSPELRLVFPHLKRSATDSWREDRIVVERPRYIRDASIAAVGLDTRTIQGSRLNWIIVDDALDRENTDSAEQRAKTIDFVCQGAESRLDPVGGRLVVNNTAWHPEDLVHYMKDPVKGGYAALRYTITGDVYIEDDRESKAAGLDPWDHELLRPKYAYGEDYACRLVRDGVDDSLNDVPLFPERFFYFPWELPDGTVLPPPATMDEAIERARWDIEAKRRQYVARPADFQRFYMGIARDDDSAMCKREWIEAAKELARNAGYFGLVSEYRGSNATFTGVDLAIGLGEEHDETAFFTFEVLPDRRRRILDIDIGRWDFPTVVNKIIEKHDQYHSIVRVENNAAQDSFRQQAIQQHRALPIHPHTTGRSKAHPEHGVPGGFSELANGAWLIPCDKHGQVHPNVQKWIDACLYYSPQKHTADVLMAWFFSRAQALTWGLLGATTPPPNGQAAKIPGRGPSGGIFGRVVA